MMNDNRPGGAGLFTGGLTGYGGGAGQLSPYLNIDPSYLSEDPLKDFERSELLRRVATRAWAALDSRERLIKSF